MCGVVCDEVQKRGWHERNSHLSGLAVYNDCRFDRVSQTPGTKRGNARKPQRALQNYNGAYAGVHNTKFFEGYSPVEEANTITKSQDRMSNVDSGASLTPWWTALSLSAGKRKPYDRPKNFL